MRNHLLLADGYPSSPRDHRGRFARRPVRLPGGALPNRGQRIGRAKGARVTNPAIWRFRGRDGS